ncbi:MAG: hypothetical protein CTR53_20535 [Ferrovibrio sp.]|nr:MAG: hypothetical protein CTR53_20535 [Ferrovibrio sp.]
MAEALVKTRREGWRVYNFFVHGNFLAMTKKSEPYPEAEKQQRTEKTLKKMLGTKKAEKDRPLKVTPKNAFWIFDNLIWPAIERARRAQKDATRSLKESQS